MPDTPTTLISVKAEVEVPFDRITNAITGAIEGGSEYWCNTFLPSPDSAVLKADSKARDEIWYDDAKFWIDGGKANLEFDKPTATSTGKATIGLVQLTNGLSIMANKCPRHFGDLLNETDDATTHDVFLQCVLFGEIIFG